MLVKRRWNFFLGILAGLGVVCVAIFSSIAQASDSWVIDGIGFKSNFKD